ncbi:hypothetical protein FSP39_013852 [Pinctada imbricata]|uniref:Copper transport protein n=1 Tax=Pinctada imbricata TaxID=66713 RepID=A0AA89BPM0_PINIB|nr:hypothetical protein FSP39_013852 [Pinctada imbricata]
MDDALSIDGPKFADCLSGVYPSELGVRGATETGGSASYLDMVLSCDTGGHMDASLCDRRGDFSFSITGFSFLSGGVPSSPACGVFVSRLVRYAGAGARCTDFVLRARRLSDKLLSQGYVCLIGAMLMTVAFSIFLEFINGITKVVAEGKEGQSKGEKNRTFKEKLILNAKLSVLQMSRVLLAYLLMLCVMTMNLWIYISTMIGAGIGYFFAGILFQKSSNQESREIDNKRTEGAILLSEEEKSEHKEETQFDPLLTKDTVV